MEKQKPYIGFSPAPLLFHLNDINTITGIYHYNKELEYDKILQTSFLRAKNTIKQQKGWPIFRVRKDHHNNTT